MKTPLRFACIAFAAILMPAAAPIASCSGNPDAGKHFNCNCNDEDKPHDIACIAPSPELGNFKLRIYEGYIIDGRHCTLSVYSYEHSGDGIYCMQIIDKNLGLTAHTGRRYTLRGPNDTTLWECRQATDSAAYYFLYDSTSNTAYCIESDSTCSQSYPLPMILSADI